MRIFKTVKTTFIMTVNVEKGLSVFQQSIYISRENTTGNWELSIGPRSFRSEEMKKSSFISILFRLRDYIMGDQR